MPNSNPQTLVDRLTQRRRRITRFALFANFAVAALLVMLVYQVVADSKRSYEAQARRIADDVAALVQSDIASEMGRADAVLRATADELASRLATGRPSDVNALLSSRLQLMSGFDALYVADPAGQLRWGTALPGGSAANVFDRDYFQAARTMTGGPTVYGGPHKSRVSGEWIVILAKPVLDRGVVRGVVFGTVPVDHFARLLRRYGLEDKDALTLRHKDLRLVARYSPGSAVQGQAGNTAVSPEMRAALELDSRRGLFVSKVAIDGELRTTAYRALDGWPLTVYAGVSHSRFFAGWRQQSIFVGLVAALAWLLVVICTWLVYRAGGRQALAVQELAEQTARVKTLMRISGDGIHILDREGRLIEMSDSFVEMLRSSRDKLLGRPVWSWDANHDEAFIREWLVRLRNGDHQRIEVQHRRDDGSVFDVELDLRAVEIAGELLVFASGRDVTDVRRLMREQTAMLESELVGMAKVQGDRFAWRNAAFERLFGYERGELQGQVVAQLSSDQDTYLRLAEQLKSRLKPGDRYRGQLRSLKKNGASIWVDFSVVRLAPSEFLLMAIDVTAERLAHEQLSHAAFHDALTELPNRLLIMDRLSQALAAARRDLNRVAVCYLDLDRFKEVNDCYGHDAGDDLLRQVAGRLVANIRPSDTAGRLGGDEFVVVLSQVSAMEWRPIVQRVLDAIRAPFELHDGSVVQVGATIGVALSGPQDTRSELLERADQVMLAGKKLRKDAIYMDEVASSAASADPHLHVSSTKTPGDTHEDVRLA